MKVLCETYISIHCPVVILEFTEILLSRTPNLVDLQEQMVLFLFVRPCA